MGDEFIQSFTLRCKHLEYSQWHILVVVSRYFLKPDDPQMDNNVGVRRE